MFCSFSTSKLDTPPGSSETIASGHSGDGTKPRISDAPHTSTATNAANPQPYAIAMPRRRRRGTRQAASIPRTLMAGASAAASASAATNGMAASVRNILPQSRATPDGKAAASKCT